jgi:uncharacterized damage-inducible protein DinB
MANSKLPEVWLRGPLPGIPPHLQPVAHALLQAREEVSTIMKDFPDHLLWERPSGVASVGFHLLHLSGVLDRLLTYAKAEALTEAQLAALKSESNPDAAPAYPEGLVAAFSAQVDKTLMALQNIDEAILLEPRKVGRAGLPSTVLGLVFHAAEHTMRHVGQLLVTVRIVKAGDLAIAKE